MPFFGLKKKDKRNQSRANLGAAQPLPITNVAVASAQPMPAQRVSIPQVPVPQIPLFTSPLQFVNGAAHLLETSSDEYNSDKVVDMLHKAGYPLFGVANFQSDPDALLQELQAIQAELQFGQFTGFLLKADGDSTHFHSVVLVCDPQGNRFALHFEDSPPNSLVMANSPVMIEDLAGVVNFHARQYAPGDCLLFALNPLLNLDQPGYVESLIFIAYSATQRHQQDRSSVKPSRPMVKWHEMEQNPDVLMPLQSFSALRKEVPNAWQWTIKFDRKHAGKTLDEFWGDQANHLGQNGYMTRQRVRLQKAVDLSESEQQAELRQLFGAPGNSLTSPAQREEGVLSQSKGGDSTSPSLPSTTPQQQAMPPGSIATPDVPAPKQIPLAQDGQGDSPRDASGSDSASLMPAPPSCYPDSDSHSISQSQDHPKMAR